jgi:hypothetical protein
MMGHMYVFYWSSIPLSSHPLERRYKLITCNPADVGCQWRGSVHIDPRLPEKVLIISSFPAFLPGLLITRKLGHFGVSEIRTFVLFMPVLIFAWYYLVSWAIARSVKSLRETAKNN